MEKLDIRAASTAPAVVTAIRVIDALAALQGSASLDELTHAIDEPRSSVHRILNTLVESELLQRPGPRGGYRMGPKVMTWGSSFLRAVNLIDEFRAVVTPIVDRIDETMQLAVLDWPDVVFLSHVDSTRPVRLVTEVGPPSPGARDGRRQGPARFLRHLGGRLVPPPRDAAAHAAHRDDGRRAGTSAREGAAPGMGRGEPGVLGEPDLPGGAGACLRRPRHSRDDDLRPGAFLEALGSPSARARAPRRVHRALAPARRRGRFSIRS